MITVELHPSLRPSAARAHRRAIAMLPRSLRVVERGAQVVVAEHGVPVDADRVVRIGPRGVAEVAGEVADSSVWWDPVVTNLVQALAPVRASIAGVRVLGFVSEADGETWVQQRLAEAVELVERIRPGAAALPWSSSHADGIAASWSTSGAWSAASVRTAAATDLFDVVITGPDLSAGLTVALGHRPSSYRIARAGRVTPSVLTHAGALRELWLSIAAGPHNRGRAGREDREMSTGRHLPRAPLP